MRLYSSFTVFHILISEEYSKGCDIVSDFGKNLAACSGCLTDVLSTPGQNML